MPPPITRWPIDEHTKGKHIVLREYLKAWFPILALTTDRCLFIDGFAGPGTYETGEPGSPLVALDVFLRRAALAHFRAEVNFIFIEARADRATALKTELDAILPQLPPTSHAVVQTDRFDVYVGGVLDRLEASAQQLAPAFLMVDPFGVSDTPLAILARLLKHPKCELYIASNASSVNPAGTDRFRAITPSACLGYGSYTNFLTVP